MTNPVLDPSSRSTVYEPRGMPTCGRERVIRRPERSQVYARRDGPPGVLILSEFAACSRVLNGALRVNPWDTNELVQVSSRGSTHASLRTHVRRCACRHLGACPLAQAMVRALCEMDPKERLARRERDLHFVLINTALVWAERFFVDLQVMSACDGVTHTLSTLNAV